MTVMPTATASPFLAGLNEAQAHAAGQPLTSVVRVLAGAGTGKTTTITRRYLKLVDDLIAKGHPNPADALLVLTFTEAAASQMRQGILEQWQHLGAERLGPLPLTDWIGTFHHMGLKLLKHYGVDRGVVTLPRLIDSAQQKAVFEKLVNRVAEGEFEDVSATLARYGLGQGGTAACSAECLSLKALLASTDTGIDQLGDLLAASWDVIERIKTSGMTPADFVRTTRAQTRAWTQRLKTMPGYDPVTDEPVAHITECIRVWAEALSNWSDSGWRPIEAVEASHGVDASPKAYEEEVAFLMKAGKQPLYVQAEGRGARRTVMPVPDRDHLEDLDSLETAELAWIERIGVLYALYQDHLKAGGYMDFNDLINEVIVLLETCPAVRKHLQEKFEAIIVDEFQDTNGAQLRLLELLLNPDRPGLTVVGDDKQSIYGFRFAQPENLALITGYAERQCGVSVVDVALSINYRSDPAILSAVNRYTTTGLNRDPAHQLQAFAPDADQASHPTSKEAVRCLTIDAPEDVPDGLVGNDTGARRTMAELKAAEADWLVEDIVRLRDTGAVASLDQVAVLVRSRTKARVLQARLSQAGVPAVCARPMGWMEHPTAKDLVALAHLLIDPHHEASLVRVLSARLSPAQIRQLCQGRHQASVSLFDWLLQLDGEAGARGEGLPKPVVSACAALAQSLVSAHWQVIQQAMPLSQAVAHMAQRLGLLGGSVGPGGEPGQGSHVATATLAL
ncbi:MAG: UvrD-helicase domain-containing protein, partial [Cyanobacteria bacterium HKST-UBA06]|nr:UvrD-helicase domain-containing protein [Cyanobacteria bacterium HKST-UBA06]